MKGKTHIASIPFCFLLFFQLTCQLNFICPRIRLSLLSNTLYLIQLWPNCMVLPVQAQLYGGEPTRTFRRYSTFPCVLFPTLFPPHGNPHILIFPCFLLFSPTHQEAYIVSAWHPYNTLVFMRWLLLESSKQPVLGESCKLWGIKLLLLPGLTPICSPSKAKTLKCPAPSSCLLVVESKPGKLTTEGFHVLKLQTEDLSFCDRSSIYPFFKISFFSCRFRAFHVSRKISWL